MASDTFRSDPERAAQLAVYLAMHCAACGVAPSPVRISRAVVAMQKAARSAKRAAERACNYPMTEAQAAAAERRLARATAKLNDELRAMIPARDKPNGDYAYAATVTLGGDPRGSCGQLHIPGQRGDGWGDGFAIY